MRSSFRFTTLKIAGGYFVLLAILLFSLLFVTREMDKLSDADSQQVLKTDSILLMMREKDENTIQMLRVLTQANDSLLTAGDIEEIITENELVKPQQRIRNRVITKRDSLITKPKKKGFFKRLAEVFVPSKKDTAVLVNTSLEFSTDTILESSKKADSIQHKIRTATRKKSKVRTRYIRKTSSQFQEANEQLTARMDSLIKKYQKEELSRSQHDAQFQQEVRMHSIRTIGGIAIGAVLLSVLFLALIWRDITRSNRYRKQLEEANRRAEELLEAREKLMLAITHDFKAPLGSIIGYTDLLSRLTRDERQHFYLENMKSSSEHLLKLVSDLLDFHRLDLNKVEINKVTFSPIQLFEEIKISFQPIAAAKGLQLHFKIAPELSENYVSDPLRIRQIVNNLLSNAIKFTTKGEVSLIVDFKPSTLIIQVVDTGKGMAPNDCKRIFQEFTRLPEAQGEEGFGLGLSIVHKLVTLLDGKISVESKLGAGSTFTVSLPLSSVKKSVAQHESGDLPTNHSKLELQQIKKLPPLSIILIDDDRIQLQMTVAMLQQQGIEAVSCERQDELIEQLYKKKFDCLLTDIQMPAINGFDLLKLLRASNIPQAKEIPVFAVTARNDIDEKNLREHGFAGCLHKPFTVNELVSLLDPISIGDKYQTSSLQAKRSQSLDFSALTAFSGDDADAARSIIETFVVENEKNVKILKQSLINGDMGQIAQVAHKMAPLFTLIGASEVAELLRSLELTDQTTSTEEMEHTTNLVLDKITPILNLARKYRP